ncbi:hypothetical protein T12_15166 [Trichinella patagoniensis]|uniref:Uncharacterized protein n=1 Tax=Trichinella patagoniensis TaxID=990121 RepID=A0A0V0YYS1_9BILA|nr:hypothetical protein T12_15166 [Trichinella patagoniensis]
MLITKFKCNLKCDIKQISYIKDATFDAECLNISLSLKFTLKDVKIESLQFTPNI